MTIGKLGMILGSEPLKLGAIALDRYVDTTITIPATLPRPADTVGYSYGMLGNDQVGDCVFASILHQQETFRLKEGVRPHPWTAHSALALYSAVTGYDPSQTQPDGSNPTDQGTDPSVAMQYWQQHGLPGHRLAGFGVLPASSPNVKRAIYEFGAVMFAVALPAEAQAQGVNWRWQSQMQPGSWGGHAICGDAYTPDLLGFISWAQEGDMDNAFWRFMGEQVLVPLSHDQIGKGGVGPAGFDFAAMQRDLGLLS